MLPLHQRGNALWWAHLESNLEYRPRDTGLQSGGAHATLHQSARIVIGQGGWSRTSDLLVPSEARYQLRHTLNLLKHW